MKAELRVVTQTGNSEFSWSDVGSRERAAGLRSLAGEESRTVPHFFFQNKATKLLKTLGSVPKSDRTIPISDTVGGIRIRVAMGGDDGGGNHTFPGGAEPSNLFKAPKRSFLGCHGQALGPVIRFQPEQERPLPSERPLENTAQKEFFF